MVKKYIEKSKVREMLKKARLISDGEFSGYCTEDIKLDLIPNADVIEVVRCKDCARYIERDSKNRIGWCAVFGCVRVDNGFCNLGVKKKKRGLKDAQIRIERRRKRKQ
jgi:hypothetical protein